MPRSRKTQLKIQLREKSNGCPFCDPNREEVVEEYSYFYVLENIYPYANWDLSPVDKHYMVTPKLHKQAISELNKKESLEYIDIMSNYQQKGYSTYTRFTNSHMSSQPHMHTHLLKLAGKQHNIEIFIKKPFINLHF